MSFGLQPHLKGELLELRPLAPEDWDDLFAVASDPLIWEQHPESEIGSTFLAPRYWGGSYNAEMKRLLLDHAFKFVKNLVFFVGEHNFRSQHALEKIGATREGLVKRTYGNHPPHLNVKYGIKK